MIRVLAHVRKGLFGLFSADVQHSLLAAFHGADDMTAKWMRGPEELLLPIRARVSP